MVLVNSVSVPVISVRFSVIFAQGYLQEVSGDGGGVEAFSGDGFVGFVFSLLEKSGWLLSPRVALSLGVSGSSTVLVASDPVLLATKTTERSLQGPGCNFYFIQRCLCKDVCVIFYMNQ